jgi:hypothetical protein
MSSDFKPYRVGIRFLECKEAPIKPLLSQLTFIKNKEHWGAVFRFGQLKISDADFALISRAMGCGVIEQNAAETRSLTT